MYLIASRIPSFSVQSFGSSPPPGGTSVPVGSTNIGGFLASPSTWQHASFVAEWAARQQLQIIRVSKPEINHP